MGFLCFLGVFFLLHDCLNNIMKRADRANEKLSLITGLLTLVAAILYIVFFSLYYIARSIQLSFSMSKAYLAILHVTDIQITLPILGPLGLGTILSGLDLLFIDPRISSVFELYLQAGLLPLGIICILIAIGFFKQSE